MVRHAGILDFSYFELKILLDRMGTLGTLNRHVVSHQCSNVEDSMKYVFNC